MGGISSAVIGGLCGHSPVVHELVAKFADMTAKDTAKEHGWQLKEATAYQRGRGMARLPRKQNRAPALRGPQHRLRTHASPPPDLGREVESRETQSTVVHPWDAGSGRLSRGSQALWRRLPAPAACGRAAGMHLRERFAHGEGNGHT
jgi:hypothetical protein